MVLLLVGMLTLGLAEDLRVPAFTAYLDPDSGGARVSRNQGVTRWTDPGTTLTWFGELKTTGSIRASVVLRLPRNKTSRLRLTIAGQAHEGTVPRSSEDLGPGGELHEVAIDFGAYRISERGYHAFVLESLNPAGRLAGNVQALVLAGEPIEGARFNLKPRRNAASVHLFYPAPERAEISAFYCEMTGVEDPLWTYYMACGWHRGYFGMQVNSAEERRIIFSVWDSGGEAVDREKVAPDDRVQLISKGEGVYTGGFGNEGTGGHSHWKYSWKTGERQRFLVTADRVDSTHTVFTGYYFRPDTSEWKLISSWKAPKEGGYLRGLYSFSENFGGRNGHLLRKALYGNQWIRTREGEWIELTSATFSHDPTGKSDRLDRFAGVEDGQFFLSHGGFTPGFTEYGKLFRRRSSARSPASMTLPPLPPAVTNPR